MILYNQVVCLPMELHSLCIDFVFQFIVEKYRNKLNQIKKILFFNLLVCLLISIPPDN